MLERRPIRTRLPLAGAAVLALLLAAAAGRAAETTYTVRKNDTLSSIARAHATTTAELVRLNGLASANRIRVGQELKVPAQEIEYVVQPGDVLSAIARAHHVDTATLVQYNRLEDPDRLAAGLTLRIPLHPDAAPVPRLDPKVERQLDRIRVRGRRWSYIVVHHSATRNGTVEGMDRYHREERHMQNGLAYHFVIGNGNGIRDGAVEIAPRWKKQLNGGHLASEALNARSIGICLVGDFEKDRPTARQMDSLRALCRYLVRRCDLSATAIKTHTQINTKPTRCPGRHFPTEAFLGSLRR